ncbi:uncharacterized protein LOC111378775 [Olea europaea var. sylvestris]|uniref:uncharacterized protein LOC111378775 n=1 Tax=Olea europaea var. sylvestris TaxID=158386 RepID=UPI000C1D55C9|nr:uncharacterized protein LOC111378775 [Olea europaea var. sylvestris]
MRDENGMKNDQKNLKGGSRSQNATVIDMCTRKLPWACKPPCPMDSTTVNVVVSDRLVTDIMEEDVGESETRRWWWSLKNLGIELLQADAFDLHCFQSLTGTKFFVVCEPGTLHMEALLKHIYELYTDYVLKNLFYEMEMPISCELFDVNLAREVQKDRVALLGR